MKSAAVPRRETPLRSWRVSSTGGPATTTRPANSGLRARRAASVQAVMPLPPAMTTESYTGRWRAGRCPSTKCSTNRERTASGPVGTNGGWVSAPGATMGSSVTAMLPIIQDGLLPCQSPFDLGDRRRVVDHRLPEVDAGLLVEEP